MKKDLMVLKHMLDDIRDIEEFTAGVDFSQFTNNVMLRKAVCMSLINIGELAKQLSKEFREKNRSIPWKTISGLRDVAAHKYHTLDYELVWNVVIAELNPLKIFLADQLQKKIGDDTFL